MSRSSPGGKEGSRYSCTRELHGQRHKGERVLVQGQMTKAEGLDVDCRMRYSKGRSCKIA